MAVMLQAMLMLVCAYALARLFVETEPSRTAKRAACYVAMVLVFCSCTLGVLGGNGARP